MKDSRRSSRSGLLLLLALVALPTCLAANNLKHFTTVFQTDYAVFSVGGMRGQGTGEIDVSLFGDAKTAAPSSPGAIVVSGIQQSPIKVAYLYWHGPTDDPGDTNANVNFNGTDITGVNIGQSGPNCWEFQNSKAYRADVTSLVTGDGVYTLSNFRKTEPFLAEINGVSLVIFYDDGNPENDRDVVLFDGNDSDRHNPFDSDGWNATLSDINYTAGTVNLFLIVSDGQGEFDEDTPDDELRVNGVTFLPACGLNWQGDTVPDQGTAQDTNGGLWDQKIFDVTSLMSPGFNTLKIQPTAFCDDCLSLIAAIFDLPAGSAPRCDSPPPPPQLSVDKTEVTFGQAVTLSWNETIPAGQGHYAVQVSFDGGSFSTIGSVPATGSDTATFVYALASPGNYRFQVMAIERECSSTSNSVFVTATGPCPQAPAVTGVTVDPTSAQPGDSFTLTWNPVPGFDTFDVFLSTDGGQSFQRIGTTVGTSFMGTVTQGPGTTLTFEVEVSGCVYSQKSNFATLTVLCDPPGSVTNIQIQAFGVTPARAPSPTDYILVSWTPPATGTAPTRYGVRINGDPEVLVVGTSVVLPPRGGPDPITAFVTAYACAPLASAELYDPAAGAWSVTGNLKLPRQAHTASLLDDGRVLIAGGVTNTFSAPTPTAELYDPASASWTTTATLLMPRAQHAATALPGSGSGAQGLMKVLAGSLVLVEGGLATEPLSSTEVFDPTAGSWTMAGSLGTARYLHTATLLTNGKVLVTGGLGSGPLSSAELFDPVAKTFTATGSLATARYRHTATLLADGRVLVAGGFGEGSALSSAEIYDPAMGTWSSTGSLAAAREAHASVLLASGNVLVAGGDDGSASLASAEIYNPATGVWTATGNLVTARRGPVAVSLPNGQVLVAGGQATAAGEFLTSAELYNPATGVFVATGSLHGSHGASTATLLGSGKVLLAGAADSLGTERAGPTVASGAVALFLTPPVASFTISANPTVGAPVIFTDTSSPQATSWLWIFDDNTSDPRQSPTHVFSTAGTHQVSLIASNSAGSSTATQSFVVAPAAMGLAPVTVTSVIAISSEDPQRRWARVQIRDREAVLLEIKTSEGPETIVFLRFVTVTGALVNERRLSIPPGGDAVFDLAAYGWRGEFVIELVSDQSFEATLSVPARPSVREIQR